jgi:hypothetical protein
MRQRASAVFARVACLFYRGLWLKLLITNAELTGYQVATTAHRLKRGEVFVHAHHPSANITQALVTAVALCFCAQVIRGQVGAQTQTFVIHGTPKTCSEITQLDSALSADYQQFFAGWTEKDYVDAVAWSQACSEYGWHVQGRPRIPLLQAQHDRVPGSAQTQIVSSTATGGVLPSPPVQAAIAAPVEAVASPATGSALPNPPVQAPIAAPPEAVASAATGSALPSPPVQAAIAAPAEAVASAATGSALPSPPVQAAIAAPAEAVASAATGSALPNPPIQSAIAALAQAVPSTAKGTAPPIPHVRRHTASDGDEDSLLADNFFKEHFHQESLWVANKANLDIGDDREPSSWSSSGMPAQMKNRLTADRIVLYCARKTNDEPGKRPLLWDLRWCEAEEASAYNRLVSGNEFPTAGRGVVLGCAGVDSYVNLERCMETLTEAGKH